MDTKRLFRSEVEIMSKYNHENLLKLIGYSANRSECCLVYSFMSNGSLEDRLACKVNDQFFWFLMLSYITISTYIGSIESTSSVTFNDSFTYSG